MRKKFNGDQKAKMQMILSSIKRLYDAPLAKLKSQQNENIPRNLKVIKPKINYTTIKTNIINLELNF